MADNDSKEINFALFPNLASQTIDLYSKAFYGSIEIKFLNTEGKFYKAAILRGRDSYSVDISELSAGFYFIRIKTESGNVEVKKFIKE